MGTVLTLTGLFIAYILIARWIRSARLEREAIEDAIAEAKEDYLIDRRILNAEEGSCWHEYGLREYLGDDEISEVKNS